MSCIISYTSSTANQVNVRDIEDYCFINTEVSIEKNKIYETYKGDFCNNNGYKSFGNSQFFKELKRQVPEISESQPREDGVRIRVLEGISLRNDR